MTQTIRIGWMGITTERLASRSRGVAMRPCRTIARPRRERFRTLPRSRTEFLWAVRERVGRFSRSGSLVLDMADESDAEKSSSRDELRTIAFRLREIQRLLAVRAAQENRWLEAEGLKPVETEEAFKEYQRAEESRE